MIDSVIVPAIVDEDSSLILAVGDANKLAEMNPFRHEYATRVRNNGGY